MTEPPTQGQQLAPHRGVMILVFGILGVVFCGIFAVLAWVFGNGDLAEIDAGRMDPSGRGLVSAGRVLGIIGTVLWILWILGVVTGFLAIPFSS